MDTAQWPQGIGNSNSKPVEKKPRPQKEQALNCPRCNSTNTKFCYYNNYSLSQPRYFCKTCRRYWTEGGSLRNVPVGGGSRKNKRSSTAAPPPPPPLKKVLNDHHNHNPLNFSPQNPRIQDGHDLNLTYNPSHYNSMSEFHHNLPFMELLKTNMSGGVGGGLSSFMSAPISEVGVVGYSSGLPSSSFGFSDGFGNLQNVEDQTNQSSRILFPFEERKPVSNNDQFGQERVEGESNGYWNGMLAGGSW